MEGAVLVVVLQNGCQRTVRRVWLIYLGQVLARWGSQIQRKVLPHQNTAPLPNRTTGRALPPPFPWMRNVGLASKKERTMISLSSHASLVTFSNHVTKGY